jgi:hypothetical protein
MVVSDIKDKLSPKKLPPTTTAVASAVSVFVLVATPTAMGVSAAIVPQLVPILIETMHDVTNSPVRIKLPGRNDSTRLTTLCTHPMSFAILENAPANMKISNMSMIPPWSSVLRGIAEFSLLEFI